jgi:hypothetical protein
MKYSGFTSIGTPVTAYLFVGGSLWIWRNFTGFPSREVILSKRSLVSCEGVDRIVWPSLFMVCLMSRRGWALNNAKVAWKAELHASVFWIENLNLG